MILLPGAIWVCRLLLILLIDGLGVSHWWYTVKKYIPYTVKKYILARSKFITVKKYTVKKYTVKK